MSTALLFPDRVSSVGTMDMGCIDYMKGNRAQLLTHNGHTTKEIVQGLLNLELEKPAFTSIMEVQEGLLRYMPWLKENKPLLNFLLSNYGSIDSRYVLKINLRAICSALDTDIFTFPFSLIEERPIMHDVEYVLPFKKTSFFLKPANSKWITYDDFKVIKSFFPLATIHTIQKTGHWMHIENPSDVAYAINQINDN